MADESPEEQQVPTAEQGGVLQLSPAFPVFAIKPHPEEPLDLVVQEPLKKHELKSRMRAAIPNPFKPHEDERFLPGLVYGNGVEFVMEIGQSFGALSFEEDRGWVCHALIPKTHVMSEVLTEALKREQEKQEGSFTERLVKKTKKVKE